MYTSEHAADRAIKLWRESQTMSGHYLVTRDGTVWQFLRDSDAGWHAGNREYNLRSIAIAAEGFADPLNPENTTKVGGWETDEEFKALARLIQWLCERHQIPIDRAHIIGKNQVPGVVTPEFPDSGPQYWGGASNKSSPGAHWNWAKLMEALGRKPVWMSLATVTNCVITTLPEPDAPVITSVPAGERLQSYDRYGRYRLVLVARDSVPQPNLPAGRYHHDGWVPEEFVRELPTSDHASTRD